MSELGKTRIAIYVVSSILLALVVVAVVNNYSSSNYISPGLIQSPQNNFVILMNDPPVLPLGQVNSLYLYYSNILLHSSSDKWISLNESGSINLLEVQNVARIIAVENIPMGKYNIIRLENLSATVNYYGQNYSVEVYPKNLDSNPSNSIIVNSKNITFVDIAIFPKLFILGNEKGGIQFDMILKSKAFGTNDARSIFNFASTTQLSDFLKKGNNVTIVGTEIYKHIYSNIANAKVIITNVTISEDELSINIMNVGNATVEVNYILIYSFKNQRSNAPSFISTIFIVNKDGSLQQINTLNTTILYSNSTGYIIQPGEEVTLYYNGELNFVEFNNSHGWKSSHAKLELISGEKFTIVLVGDYSILASTQIILIKE